MTSNVFKAVCRNLMRIDDGVFDLCCLCLQEAGKDSYCANDNLKIDLDGDGAIKENLTEVLKFLIGENISETLIAFKSVCRKCTQAALDSYKFIQRSAESASTLKNTVQKLETCFIDIPDNMYDCQSIYVYINPSNKRPVIKEYYDWKWSSEETIHKYHIKKEKDNIASRKNNHCSNINDHLESDIDNKASFRIRPRYTNIVTEELLYDKTKPNEYKCKYCLHVLASKKYLREHFLRIHCKTDKQKKKFTKKCNECEAIIINTKEAIKEHELSHHGDYKCSLCNRKFKQLWFYNKHRAQKSCDYCSKGEFICDYCGRKMSNKFILVRHIKFQHLGVKKNVCAWCGKNCQTPSELKLHILKHTKEKTAVCSQCGQTFVNLHSLNNHMKLHTGEKPCICEYCNQGFKNASLRKEHIRRKHLPPSEKCDICCKVFKTKGSLYKHKRRHKDSSHDCPKTNDFYF